MSRLRLMPKATRERIVKLCLGSSSGNRAKHAVHSPIAVMGRTEMAPMLCY